MKVISVIVSTTCAVLFTVGMSLKEGWRGLVALHSTRADVERQLGPPKESSGAASTYETKNEKVLVFFSLGPCIKGNAWNVPLDTIVSFTVSPKAKSLVADLRLDYSKYKRVGDPHIQGAVHYVNKEDGIRISAALLNQGGEDVSTITYEATAKDDHLRCSSAPAVSDADAASPSPYKFDEYSNIRSSDERARLNNFARYLRENSKLIGYIITYSGRRSHAGEAKARAERVKGYLVNHGKIDDRRIVTIDGGHRETTMVELYATSPGASPPAPTPTAR